MTRLRKMMLEELERRNYSEGTTRCYIRTVEDFSRRFKRSPGCLGPDHFREYQAELFKKRKLSPGTVTQRLAALRFFYIKTLKKTWSIAETPYPKRAFHLPSILSREEVARLIDAALTPYHRTLLMTLYATGVRRAELTHLKVSDIDSKRMVIHVQGGKGRKDRDVMLSPKLLEVLREHWRGLPRKPSAWLFPGNRWHTGDTPIDTKVVWNACKEAAQRMDDYGVFLSGLRDQSAPVSRNHVTMWFTSERSSSLRRSPGMRWLAALTMDVRVRAGGVLCSLGQTGSLQNCYKQLSPKLGGSHNGSFFRYFQNRFDWGCALARCGRKSRSR